MILYGLLSQELKKKILAAMFLLAISGVIDTAFVVLMATYLKQIFFQGTVKSDQIGLVSAIYILIIFSLKVFFGIYSQNYGSKLACDIRNYLQVNLVKKIIDINSSIFGNKSSKSKNISKIFNETQKLQAGYILPILTLPSDIVAIIGIISYLMYVNLEAFIFILIIAIIVILAPILYARKKLALCGENIQKNEVELIQAIESISDGDVEIVSSRNVNNFFSRSEKLFHSNRELYFDAFIYSQLPRHAVEYSFYLVIVLIILITILMSQSELFLAIVPAFAFGLLRIMPSLNKLAYFISSYSFTKKYRDGVILDLTNPTTATDNLIENKNFQSISYAGYNFNRNLIYLIKGKSGSGKTTFINKMLGINGDAELIIDGVRQNKKLFNLINLHYISQNSYFEETNFFDNFKLFARNNFDFEYILKSVKILMPKFDISNYESNDISYKRKISGGELQKLSIIRSLINRPDMLVFDEATSAMDESSINDVMKFIIDYKNQVGCLIIIISHQDLVANFADITYEF
jgi:ABC-type multidrug transport system ATPase subunit